MKSRLLKGLKIFADSVLGLVLALFKTVFIDLFKNIGIFMLFAFKPEEKKKLKNKLEAEKMVKLLEDRLKSVERLLYAIYNDPEYVKRKEGKYDLKELGKAVKK